MEKENAELYRQCNHLQSNIAQLEAENAEKSKEVVEGVRRTQLEGELRRMNREKTQLERVLSQREQNYEQGRRAMELQTTLLREQLERERRRRSQLVRNSHHFEEIHTRSIVRRANSERRASASQGSSAQQ